MEALLINASKVQIREDVWRTKSCMERTPVQLFSVGGGAVLPRAGGTFTTRGEKNGLRWTETVVFRPQTHLRTQLRPLTLTSVDICPKEQLLARDCSRTGPTERVKKRSDKNRKGGSDNFSFLLFSKNQS